MVYTITMPSRIPILDGGLGASLEDNYSIAFDATAAIVLISQTPNLSTSCSIFSRLSPPSIMRLGNTHDLGNLSMGAEAPTKPTC